MNGATGSDQSGAADQGLIPGEENVPDQEELFREEIEVGIYPVVVPDQGEAIPEENIEPEEALQGEEVGRGADPEDEEFTPAHHPGGHAHHPGGHQEEREVAREVEETDLAESVQEDHLLETLSPDPPKRSIRHPKMIPTCAKMTRTR